MLSGLVKKNVFKAHIAAEYANADNFKMDVLKVSTSNGEADDLVLETDSGRICGSNAIARYVADKSSDKSSLVGATKIMFGQIEQWIDFSSVDLDLNLRGWALLRLGYFNHDKDFEDYYIGKLMIALSTLDTYLASHVFLVGDSVTLADIITTCNLLYGFELLMTKEFTSKYPNVENYFWRMINEANFKKVMGEVKQADATIPLSTVTKQEQPTEAKSNKRRFRNLSKFPKKEAKPKIPLDSPNNMVFEVLDDWKKHLRTRTNLSEAAIKGFWDMYTAQKYSIWFCERIVNDENERQYDTKDMVQSVLQHIDLAREYTFGKILITRSKVKGFWLFHPTQVITDLVKNRLQMYFKLTEVDISVEKNKKRVIQMIKSENPFEDEEIVQDICFM